MRKAIEIPAFDSTRMWRAWQAEQDQIEALQETEQRLNIKRKLERALIKARLYGGAAIAIGVDGNMEDELNPDAVKKGALKFLHVMPAYALRAGEMTRDRPGTGSRNITSMSAKGASASCASIPPGWCD